MINVLIADNQDLTREGIKALLLPITNVNVVGEAHNAVDLEKMAIKFMPEVIIMEYNYRGDFNAGYIKNLSATYPASNLLLLIGSQNREEILEPISQWGINYLFKECHSNDLINAVYATAEDKPFLCNDFVADQTTDQVAKPALSVREKEIVQLISEGMTNKDIADTLFLSIHTIKTHRKNIIKKLGFSFKNAAELVLLIGYLNDFFI